MIDSSPTLASRDAAGQIIQVCFQEAQMFSSHDYVVIGGGTAGSVLAVQLSGADARVLVLDAGPVTPPDEVYAVESFPRRD